MVQPVIVRFSFLKMKGQDDVLDTKMSLNEMRKIICPMMLQCIISKMNMVKCGEIWCFLDDNKLIL